MSETEMTQRLKASAGERGILHMSFLPIHGSPRRYARVQLGNGTATSIAMVLPVGGVRGHEIGSASAERPSESSFVEVGRFLQRHGVRSPEIYEVDDENEIIWLEDLGSTDLDAAQAAAGDERGALYEAAIDTLVAFQSLPFDDAPACARASEFTYDHFFWELEHYVEWRLENRLGVRLSDAEREGLNEDFRILTERLRDIPQTLVHRDFQSHNLMVTEDEDVAVIDFQDALVGPVVYDLVALLRDSYVVLAPEEISEHFRHWYRGAVGVAFDANVSEETARTWFRLQTLQRKLKDAGRFEYFALHNGNDSFLKYIKDTVGYVSQALEFVDGFHAIRETLNRHEPFFANS